MSRWFPPGRSRGTLLGVAAELLAHGREHLAGVIGLTPGVEALVERRRQYRSGDADIDGGENGPSPLARIRDTPGELVESGRLCECAGGEVEQPRGDDAAAPPDLSDLSDVEVVLVGLGITEGRSLGIDFAAAAACV